MFPALCRGKALKSYGLAAVTLLSACASTGPGTPASFATPGLMPARVPATVPQASAHKPSAPMSSAPKSSTRKRSAPKMSTPVPRVGSPAHRQGQRGHGIGGDQAAGRAPAGGGPGASDT